MAQRTDDTKSKLVIMLSVLSGLSLAALDQTIVSTSLPKIVESLGGIHLLSWVVSSYLLASTATIIIYGKLSDIYGRKPLFILGIAIFLFGSVLCGFSKNILELIVFRAIQGIGGGAIMVNSLAIIGDLFSPAERGKWQGLIGAVWGFASITGPPLGGFLTDYASWHWVFFINVPIGFVSMAILSKFLPATKGRGIKNIDYAGSAVLVAAITSLMLGLLVGGNYYPWFSFQTIGLFASSLALFLLFKKVEGRAKEPVLHFELFKNRIFTVSVITAFITSVGMFGAITFMPVFVQGALGETATSSGIIMIPMTVSSIIASTIAGQLISRTGKYKMLAVAGMAIATLGMALLSIAGINTTHTELIVDMVLVGTGIGITFPLFLIVVQNTFDHSKLGVVTASLQFFRSMGGLFGVTIFGTIMVILLNGQLAGAGVSVKNPDSLFDSSLLSTLTTDQLLSLRSALSFSINRLFLIASVIMAVGLLLTFLLPEIPLRKTRPPLLEEAGKELSEELGFNPERRLP